MKTKNNLKPNRLINEKNPYLLQHSNNPVNWFPWSNEAFEIAKNEDKPIFLSIGYSTCHWCHVMAHESFEDLEVAELMNKSFINIKVDREERPDIDGIYMDVCQLLTGSGGWPLTVIMTPDKKPFFAGTYFPKESMYGRIGMMDLIPKIMELWNDRRDDILFSADELTEKVKSFGISDIIGDINDRIFDKTFEALKNSYDEEFGGFGNNPKFPIPHNLMFLMNYYYRTKNMDALEMVNRTLVSMAQGGIFDHIGFGFHRYSTDRKWLVPHFEKMLYDQALLTIAFLEAYKISKNDFFKSIAIEVLTYVERDMLSDKGAFYSAEDADSEGIEGKFYLWSAKELQAILNEDYSFFAEYFNIQENGNFSDSGGHFEKQQNIIFKTNNGISQNGLKLSQEVFNDKIEHLKKKLYLIREKRIHPHKDDKILTDWNALMISAYIKAYNILKDVNYLKIALEGLEFIENNMFDSELRLLHRYHGDSAGIYANADDYAFLIRAYLDIYQTGLDTENLLTAIELNNHFILHFWDNKNYGFYFSPDYGEELIFRKKDFYDGAIPSGNSVALGNLNDIWKYTADTNIKSVLDNLIKAFSSVVSNMPMGYTQFASSYLKTISNSFEIIIVSDNEEDSIEYVNYLKKMNKDNLYLIIKTNRNADELSHVAEYLKDYQMKDSKPTAYICQNYKCENPINDMEEFKRRINELF